MAGIRSIRLVLAVELVNSNKYPSIYSGGDARNFSGVGGCGGSHDLGGWQEVIAQQFSFCRQREDNR